MNLTCKYMGYHYVNDNAYNVSNVLISVILSLLLIPALILKFTIAIAIIKENVLRTPAVFIIANMAVSDFLTTCTYLCFPVSSYYVIKGHDPCFITEKTTPLGYTFCLTSFLSIVLQSIERYLAIFYPFWYNENFTTRVVIFLNLTSWVLSICLATVLVTTKSNQVFNGVLGPIALVLFVGTIIIYVRIFKEVKRIEKQSTNQDISSESSSKAFKKESKVTKATAIILITFVTCFAPVILMTFCNSIINRTTYFSGLALYWCWFLGLLNSFCNPLVVCRQLTILRRPVTNIVFWWKAKRQISPPRISQFQNMDITRSAITNVDVRPGNNELEGHNTRCKKSH